MEWIIIKAHSHMSEAQNNYDYCKKPDWNKYIGYDLIYINF